MKRITFARLAVLLLAAGALALSGCGGDDNGGVDESLHSMVTAERDTALQAQTDAETERDTALQAQTDAETERDAALQAQTDAEAERDVTNAADAAARASNLAAALDVIRAGVDGVAAADGEAAVAADGDYGDTGEVMPGMVVVADDAPKPRTGLGLTHTAADGVMVDKINSAPAEFQEYDMDDYGPPMIDGWNGLVLMRRNDADDASQILYAYTDIMQADGETFLEKYESMLDLGKLTVNNANLAMAKSPSFPGRTEPDQSFAPTDDSDVGTTREGSFAGTFDGVPGTFVCTGTACVVMADSGTGALSMDVAQMFTFTPDDSSTTIAKTDGDYLYFGYWLHKPDNSGGNHIYSLIAGGNDMFTVRGEDPTTLTADDMRSHVHALAGQARYVGPAGGKYVTRDLAANTAQIGLFTATAELHANFDKDSPYVMADTVDRMSQEDGGVVDGIIRDFMENGESLGNWRITLMEAPLGPIGLADLADEGGATPTGMTAGGESHTHFTAAANARIGASSAAGQWVGTFYGNGRSDGEPGAIAGMFEVRANHASLSGAFGTYHE